MTHYKALIATSIATAIVALSSLAPASATGRYTAANASGRCQAALPAFEGAIRKRPLALQNEGTSSAFVTCSFVAEGSNYTIPASFTIWAANSGTAAATLSCTAVVGYNTGDVSYVAKTVTLQPTGVQGQIFWGPTEYPDGLETGAPISLSCNLPVGVGINDTYFSYEDGYAAPAAAP